MAGSGTETPKFDFFFLPQPILLLKGSADSAA